MVVGVQSPNHWTTREFPFIVMLKQMKNGKLEGAEARRRLLQWSRRKTMEAVIVGNWVFTHLHHCPSLRCVPVTGAVTVFAEGVVMYVTP